MPRTKLRRAASAVTTIAIALGLSVVGGVAPASAANPNDTIKVSADGVHFNRTLGVSLFDGLGLIVPGDTFTTSLWVKNPNPIDSEMRVSVSDLVSPSAEFSTGVIFSTFDTVGGAAIREPVADLAPCDVIVPSRIVSAHTIVRVDMTFEMLDVTGRSAQNQKAVLDLRVAMRDAEAGPFPASACDDGGVFIPTSPASAGRSTPLAFTGYEFPSALLAAAGALTGFGILLVRRRRRGPEPS